MAFKRISEIDAVDLARVYERLQGIEVKKQLLAAQARELERQEREAVSYRTDLMRRLNLPLDGSVGVVAETDGKFPRGTLMSARTGMPIPEDPPKVTGPAAEAVPVEASPSEEASANN